MHYYIDGYNLLFRVLSANDMNLKDDRQNLIEELNEKANALDLEFTIIFDSQYQSGESTRTHYDRLEILYTSQGETADEAILSEVRAELSPKNVTVITSDKKLAWFARRSSAKTESVESFFDWLNRRFKNRSREKNRPILKKPIEIPKPKQTKSITPTPKSALLECFNYYLDRFEKEFEEISKKDLEDSEKNKKVKKVIESKPSKKTKKIKSKKEAGISDVKRWLQAFERDISKDEYGA